MRGLDSANEVETFKRRAAEAAVGLVKDGMVLGLGTGSTVRYFLEALADHAHAGVDVRGVPTSRATDRLAKRLGITLTSLEEHPRLDLAVDGADEVGPRLALVKGGGGALLREKIVAAAAKRFVVIADESKVVRHLGQRDPVPAEVSPFGWPVAKPGLEALGCVARLRRKGSNVVRTDNGNYLLDCRFPQIRDPAKLERDMKAVPGVIESGLFVEMADLALIGGSRGVWRLTRAGS